jgi:hypothetical protein
VNSPELEDRLVVCDKLIAPHAAPEYPTNPA